MLTFLEAVVRGRGNVLIAGPTGTGKTTLLRYLGAAMDPGARVVVLEQTAELGLERLHPHVVALEARHRLDMAQLLQHALHRRPDYIVMWCLYERLAIIFSDPPPAPECRRPTATPLRR
jgi:pilus assembly protein CpaF